jgi:membrane protease YdiL (CAAX protease family)
VQLVIFAGLTGGIFVVSYIVGVGIVAQLNHLSISSIASLTPDDLSRPEMAGLFKGLLIVQFFGLFFLPPLVFSYLADPQPLNFVGLKPPHKRYFLFLGLITMIAAYFMVEWMAALNEQVVTQMLSKSMRASIEKGEAEANSMLENILTMKNPKDLLYSVFLVGVLPAVGEELFFRGVLQRLFIQIFKSAWPGIIFTAALFSAFHGQFMGFLPRMILGIVLGTLYWYSGSIFTSMIGHFVYNTMNVLLIYFKISELDSKNPTNWNVTFIGLISLAVVVFLINFLRKKSPTSYADVYPPLREDNIFDDPDKTA